MKHPCIVLYEKHGNGFSIGHTAGVCRITGEQSTGMPFQKWVKDTFTDINQLRPGTIISNAASFCFVEDSALIQAKTGRDKPQKFRTYSHILTLGGEWHCLTKADKKRIVQILKGEQTEIVCLTDSGQKHVFFKHRPGFWQLDEMFVIPDVAELTRLHAIMQALQSLGFGQDQIKTGKYHHAQIIKTGFSAWQKLESQLTPKRGTPIFDFSAWLMYSLVNKEE